MKKTIKIIFIMLSLLAVIFSIIYIIKGIDDVQFLYELYEQGLVDNATLNVGKKVEMSQVIFWAFCCFTNILFFCVVNFKDLQFITESFIGMFKETENKRKENKKKALAKDIEKKQALLNEMQKDEE